MHVLLPAADPALVAQIERLKQKVKSLGRRIEELECAVDGDGGQPGNDWQDMHTIEQLQRQLQLQQQMLQQQAASAALLAPLRDSHTQCSPRMPELDGAMFQAQVEIAATTVTAVHSYEAPPLAVTTVASQATPSVTPNPEWQVSVPPTPRSPNPVPAEVTVVDVATVDAAGGEQDTAGGGGNEGAESAGFHVDDEVVVASPTAVVSPKATSPTARSAQGKQAEPEPVVPPLAAALVSPPNPVDVAAARSSRQGRRASSFRWTGYDKADEVCVDMTHRMACLICVAEGPKGRLHAWARKRTRRLRSLVRVGACCVRCPTQVGYGTLLGNKWASPSKGFQFSSKLSRAEALIQFRKRFEVPLEWEELVTDPNAKTEVGRLMTRSALHHLIWVVRSVPGAEGSYLSAWPVVQLACDRCYWKVCFRLSPNALSSPVCLQILAEKMKADEKCRREATDIESLPAFVANYILFKFGTRAITQVC
jgi:hypothetical protein